MEKKKDKTVKRVRSTDGMNQKIAPIAHFDESSTDFLDKTEEEMDFEDAEMNDASDDEAIIIPYDPVWKKIIEEFYVDFMQFFLPDLFAQLDASVEPVFLDQELLMIQKELNIPKQITDKLIKVRLKDGSERWILIHIEIQTKFELLFSTRMYLYQAFIFAKYRLPITALAVFTRPSTPKNFDIYETTCFGTTLTYRYNAYKIAKQNEVELMNSDNIFALFVLAHLYVIKTTPQKYEQRRIFKEKLFELTKKKQFPDDKVTRMLIFVDQILELPISLQNSFSETMAHKDPDQLMIETEAKMKASEAYILGSTRRYRIQTLGLEGYLDLQEKIRTATLEAHFERLLQSKVARAAWDAKAEAKAEMQKAETERRKVEAQLRKAEKQKAEQKAEAEKLHYLVQSVTALHSQAAFSADKIATILQLPLNEVTFILGQHNRSIPLDSIVPKLKEFQTNALKNK
jgi:hypothetical protein